MTCTCTCPGPGPYGITVYPPAHHAPPGYWRAITAFKYPTLRRAKLVARLTSVFGLWVLGSHDLVGYPRPALRDRYVAIETEEWDLDRYHLGRRIW